MNKTTVESVFSTLSSMRWPVIVALGIAIAGCGGGGSSTPPSSSEGLWVPNFASSNIVEFDAQGRAQSGDPNPSLTNVSTSLGDPDGVTFDQSKTLWASNCEDPVTGYGSINAFSRDQLDHLGSNPTPDPVVTMSDDGNGDIFDCPYGVDFDTSGNLWTVNRYLRDLIEFTPAQLMQGGVQYPNTEITSIDFTTPLGSTFDTSGTIWMTDFAQNEVYGFTAASLSAASGSIMLLTPDIINSSAGLVGPAAIAFDSAGDQWVANCLGSTLTEFAPLTASGSPIPLVELSSTTVTTPSGSAPSLACPEGLAFDRNGNLWVSNAISDNTGSIAKFSRTQLAVSGSPVPAVFLDSNPDATNIAQPSLLSFDR